MSMTSAERRENLDARLELLALCREEQGKGYPWLFALLGAAFAGLVAVRLDAPVAVAVVLNATWIVAFIGWLLHAVKSSRLLRQARRLSREYDAAVSA